MDSDGWRVEVLVLLFAHSDECPSMKQILFSHLGEHIRQGGI